MPAHPAMHRLRAWNRKLHNYVGLYLLLFIWLFGLSGVLLNHPTWDFTQFWPQRETTTQEAQVEWSAAGTLDEQVASVLGELEITGEIERIARSDGQHLEIRLVQPGRITDITTDPATGRTQITRVQTNAWGIVQWLHHFTGVRMDRPEAERDWVLTHLWSLAMDATCAGLVFLVVSGLTMSYARWRVRPVAWLSLGAGCLACAFLLFGLDFLL